MSNPSRTSRIAVVGAGVAGLFLARDLVRGGYEVTVFDKGRGPGGRLATRRAAPFTFDHGAQYFTARDPEFRLEVETWIEAGCAARWNGRLAALEAESIGVPGDARNHRREERGEVGASDERFVGVPGMTRIASALAEELAASGAGRASLARGVRVTSIETTGAPRGARLDGVSSAACGAAEATSRLRHVLYDERGDALGTFDFVCVTTPPSQAAPLVAVSPHLHGLASAVAMSPCWATMVAFAAPLEVDFVGAFVQGGPLAWVCHDGSKPGRAARDTWVLHASAEWSHAHLEDGADEVARASLDALRAALGVDLPGVLHSAAHRWRYAASPGPRAEGAPLDPALGLGLAGDWLCGSNVESAWRSARDLAQRIRVFDR